MLFYHYSIEDSAGLCWTKKTARISKGKISCCSSAVDFALDLCYMDYEAVTPTSLFTKKKL